MPIPTIDIPPKWRLGLYLLAAIALIVVSYAVDKSWAGEAEVRLVTALAALINLLAAAKVTKTDDTLTSLTGTVVSESGETGVIDATLAVTEHDTDDGYTYEEAGGMPYPADGDEAGLYKEQAARKPYDAYDTLPGDTHG